MKILLAGEDGAAFLQTDSVCLLLVIKIKTCIVLINCVNDNWPIPTYQSADTDYL